MERLTVGIEGMSCEHCVWAVKNALEGLPGVNAVKVSLQSKSAELEYDPLKLGLEEIKAAIREEGYEA
ncbi:MAG: cation transporter [Clostridium sp.]|jgi:copper chaperone|nr:cation transporter [Clostridium sp.]